MGLWKQAQGMSLGQLLPFAAPPVMVKEVKVNIQVDAGKLAGALLTGSVSFQNLCFQGTGCF